MGKVTNITKWECDRCGRKLYAAPGDPEAATWVEASRTNASGDRMSFVLCTDCSKSHSDLATRHDSEFTAFINEYKKHDYEDGKEAR